MRVNVFVLAVAAVLAGWPVPGSAQSAGGPVIRGWVADSTGRPVAFARVTGEGAGERVADDSGRFLLVMPKPGAIRLEARRVGFHPLLTRIEIRGDTTLRLVMVTLPASLAKVEIEAEATVRSLEMNGFYRRLRDKKIGANTGHFILPEEIEKRRGTVLQVMQGTPGIHIMRYQLGGDRQRPPQLEYMAAFGNSRKSGRALCPMAVYLDRMRLSPPPGSEGLAERYPPPPDIAEYVTLREVAGVEIYTRSNAPPEYSTLNGTCGVILIWTK